MPAKEILIELKSKIPYKYTKAIIPAYKKRHYIDRSRWTAMQSFKEYGYSKKQHNTIINEAFTQQILKNKTDHLTGGRVYKVSILQYCRERKGLIQ